MMHFDGKDLSVLACTVLAPGLTLQQCSACPSPALRHVDPPLVIACAVLLATTGRPAARTDEHATPARTGPHRRSRHQRPPRGGQCSVVFAETLMPGKEGRVR